MEEHLDELFTGEELPNLSQEEDIKKIMETGAIEYLVKSNTPIQEVINRLKAALLQP